MSIWASFGIFDGDLGDQPRPIRYQRSHVLPGPDDERAGYLDLGLIPGHITRDGRDDGPDDDDSSWPYLRIAAAEDDDAERVTVVFDVTQVEHLRDQLTWWLGRVNNSAK